MTIDYNKFPLSTDQRTQNYKLDKAGMVIDACIYIFNQTCLHLAFA